MTRKGFKKKAVDKAKEITRSAKVCAKCGKMEGQFHASHILGQGAYPSMAAELDNIICLCASCHKWGHHSWHAEPIENADWFRKTYPGRYERLIEMAQTKIKADWEGEYIQLKGRR